MRSLPRLAAAGAATALLSLPALAQWTGAAGNLRYTDTANWTDGAITGVFNGALPTSPYELLFPDASTYTFTTGLTVNFTTGGGTLRFVRDGFSPITFTLGGDISVDAAGDGQLGTFVFGTSTRVANIDLGGVTRTFYVAGQSPLLYPDTLAVNGAISNGGINKTGHGALNLNGANTYSGKTMILGGRVTLGTNNSLHGSIANSSVIAISGQNTQLVMAANGSVTDRVGDSVPVVLAGGLLHFDVSSASGRTETLGTVTLAGGRSSLGVGRTGGTNTGSITVTTLDRTNYATLNLHSYAPSAGGVIKLVNDANVVADLVGGGGADGTTTKSIVPWLTMGSYHINTTDSTGYSSTAGLVTYDATNKTLRALDQTTEYRVNDIDNSGATENNRISASAAVSDNKTINALFVSGASTLTIAAGKTLTVTSGAIATGGNATTISGGTLDFGSRTGVFTGRNTSSISSVITGSAGFIAANIGTGLTVSGVNTYTGPTIVQGNLFTGGGSERIANSSHLQVDGDGTFGVGSSFTETLASLSGRGTVRLEGTGSRLIFGSGSGTAGAVTFGAGSFVSPGDGSGEFINDVLKIGTSSKATNVVFEAGSSFNVGIGGLQSFDSLQVVNGNVSITGGDLLVSISGSFVASEGDSFKVITASGTGTGNFTNLSAGWTGGWVGKDYILTYSAIPEPATFSAMIGGVVLAMSAFGRRRR